MGYGQGVRIRFDQKSKIIKVSDTTETEVFIHESYEEFLTRAMREWVVGVEEIEEYCKSEVDRISVEKHQIKIFI